jgi:hypothetical protein
MDLSRDRQIEEEEEEEEANVRDGIAQLSDGVDGCSSRPGKRQHFSFLHRA